MYLQLDKILNKVNSGTSELNDIGFVEIFDSKVEGVNVLFIAK